MPAICTLASSSKGNASFVTEGETALLLDAGISLRRLTRDLEALGTSPGGLSAVLVTHEHSDHVRGAAFAGGQIRCADLRQPGHLPGAAEAVSPA